MRATIIVILKLFLISNNDAFLQEFATGNNIFTANFYNEIAKTNKENILISPLSTEIIFALAQSGARGDTAEEIRKSLHLPNTNEEIESAIKTVLPLLKDDETYSLRSANKMYVKKGFSIKEEFSKSTSDIYGSKAENIDFTAAKQAASTMNKWVEDHTNNKIHNIINPEDLDELTAAVLINTLYFKGEWEAPFSNYSTWKQKFYKTSQNSTDVDMMHASDKSYNYYEDKELDATFLELPFKGQDLSMVIILPNQKDGISTLETQIDKLFTERSFHNQHLNVHIPKFRIENKIDLKQALSNLGVKKAFDEFQADFSGISDTKLHIDSARQKTFMEVNEGGVEAAAASFIELAFESASLETPKNFIADHPFMFYIKLQNIILFVGRVADPDRL